MNAQGDPLGAGAARPRFRAPFVVVTGGKGGVGKTTIAANLGVELARSGRRVLLVDLDLALANLHVALQLEPSRTLEDFLAGRCPLAACAIEGPGGVRVIPAASGAHDLARADSARRRSLLEGLADLSGGYDLVLGDVAAGIGPDVLSFAAAADYVLAVTTPEPAALTDVYGVVKALDAWSREQSVELPTPEVFVNLVSGPEEADAVATKLRVVSQRFLARSPRLAGWLPRAREVLRSVAAQKPFVLTDRASLAAGQVARLAERVGRHARAEEAA